ncbi:MAG TPA: aminotransferase class I/II-fold pyridoxal phosphate-dependent enzyme [Vicinamibacterales bacterium]
MRIPTFEMERMQSTWENLVDYDMSESGVRPITLRELVEMGFDLDAAMDTPLGYSQSNGTLPLRELLTAIYPGATVDHIEVTNGTSEANYIVALSRLVAGDEVAMEVPNYMQLWGVPHSLQATINTFRLRPDRDWEPDWDEFERAVNPRTRLLYLSNPNNPSGAVLSDEAMRRIVRRCEEMNTLLLADEVYLGAEIEDDRTKSFWGMSDKVVVTSGLSKAYGIPGVRIGWIIGPPAFIATCWSQHDYLTIGPNKLSDLVARTAVSAANREKLYARTRALLNANLPIISEWAARFGGLLSFNRPRAGAMALVQYHADVPSLELCERIRKTQSTLIVPGSHVGLEGYLRLWYGGRQEYITEGFRRVGLVLETLR